MPRAPAPQLADDLRRAQRLAVGAGRADMASIDVGDGDDARGDAGIGPRRRARRGSRVPSQRSWWWRTTARTPSSRSSGASRRSPISGCARITRELLGVERRRLEQDPVRDADLADVVQDRAEPDVSSSSRARPSSLGDADGERGEPLAMAVQARLARLDRVRERAGERRRDRRARGARARCAATRSSAFVDRARSSSACENGFVDEPVGAARERLAQVPVRAGARHEHDRAGSAAARAPPRAARARRGRA